MNELLIQYIDMLPLVGIGFVATVFAFYFAMPRKKTSLQQLVDEKAELDAVEVNRQFKLALRKRYLLIISYSLTSVSILWLLTFGVSQMVEYGFETAYDRAYNAEQVDESLDCVREIGEKALYEEDFWVANVGYPQYVYTCIENSKGAVEFCGIGQDIEALRFRNSEVKRVCESYLIDAEQCSMILDTVEEVCSDLSQSINAV